MPHRSANDLRPLVLTCQSTTAGSTEPVSLDWTDRDSWRLVGIADGTLTTGTTVARAGEALLVVPEGGEIALRLAPGSRVVVVVFDVVPVPTIADGLRLVHRQPGRQPTPQALWGRDLPRHLTGAAGRHLVAQLELIANAFWRSPGDRLRAGARLALILADLLDAAGTEADWRSRVPDPDPIAAAKQELVRRLPRLMTVAEMADHVGWSRAHFSREFRRCTGTTASAFRERIRWREAHRQLTETRTPIATLATLLGFSGPAAFSSACRRHLGAPPTAVRAAGRRGGSAPGPDLP